MKEKVLQTFGEQGTQFITDEGDKNDLVAVTLTTAAEEYARRIVAAVNATRGIETEALEIGAVHRMMDYCDKALACIRMGHTQEAVWYLHTALAPFTDEDTAPSINSLVFKEETEAEAEMGNWVQELAAIQAKIKED